MADDPKDKKDAPAAEPSATSTSPAPTEVAGDVKAGEAKPAGGSSTPPPPDPNSKVQAEPLSDGTTPTVLAPGESHRTVPKSKASLTTVYRKADVLTTVLTFAGAVVAGVIIIGGYAYFSHVKAPATATPKVTTLNQDDLSKLNSFFEGNSAGNSTQVLTINSSSLFSNRVAISSDLKVTGGVSVDGTTTLGNLNATKAVNLGITNVGGQLTVNGPLTVQNPALFNSGATYKGNITATGTGSFGGSLSAASISVQDLSVNGTLNINGHINIGGLTPTATANQAAGSGASASVAGNDSAGTVTVSTGVVPGNGNLGGDLVKVTFRNTYPSVPTIVISPDGKGSALLQPFVLKSANWFVIVASFDATSHSSYSFDYWVAQ